MTKRRVIIAMVSLVLEIAGFSYALLYDMELVMGFIHYGILCIASEVVIAIFWRGDFRRGEDDVYFALTFNLLIYAPYIALAIIAVIKGGS